MLLHPTQNGVIVRCKLINRLGPVSTVKDGKQEDRGRQIAVMFLEVGICRTSDARRRSGQTDNFILLPLLWSFMLNGLPRPLENLTVKPPTD